VSIGDLPPLLYLDEKMALTLRAFCRGEDGIEKEHSDKGFEGEESSEEEAGPATPATPELARQQRREMKKQAKAGENDKKNISILGEPRVLTRREQYVPASFIYILYMPPLLLMGQSRHTHFHHLIPLTNPRS